MNLELKFVGPFSVTEGDNCIFDVAEGESQGIYLWAYSYDNGYLVSYVGETSRSFKIRTAEHLTEQLGGNYSILNVSALKKAKYEELWPGLYGKKNPHTVQEFMKRYIELSKPNFEGLSLLRIFVAPLVANTRTRERVEAALAVHFKQQAAPASNLFERGVVYRPKMDDEQDAIIMNCTCSKKLFGFPSRLET